EPLVGGRTVRRRLEQGRPGRLLARLGHARRPRIRSTLPLMNARMHQEHTGSSRRRKAGSAPMAELVVASNRGPVQFEVDDDGNLTQGRGAGGMVAALGPALAGQAGSRAGAA